MQNTGETGRVEGRESQNTQKGKKKQGKKPIEAEEVEGIRPHERDIMV